MNASDFPTDLLEEIGYRVFLNSAGGQNGVAILSKVIGAVLNPGAEENLYGLGRALLFNSPSIAILNIYAPNAPFPDTDAYQQKVAWLRSLYKTARSLTCAYSCVAIIGDFNIAPTTACIHKESLALYPGFLTEQLTEAWRAFAELGFQHIAPIGEGPNYTWWSYKDRGFERRVGMQIDHMLIHGTPAGTASLRIIAATREEPQTSDHAPIILSLDTRLS